jgi:hypothetical protein
MFQPIVDVDGHTEHFEHFLCLFVCCVLMLCSWLSWMKSSSMADSIITYNSPLCGVRDTGEPRGISTPTGRRMELGLGRAQHNKPDKTDMWQRHSPFVQLNY